MSLIRKTFRRLHYPTDVIAQCVRWYLGFCALFGEMCTKPRDAAYAAEMRYCYVELDVVHQETGKIWN